jgi:DNA invertase Pin-like site-specific DNA recombinase
MTQMIIHLQRLSSYGVAFHSYTEAHLATDELVRNILLALLSSLAKVEAQKISERIRAGMSRARAKGIKIGRPKLPAELVMRSLGEQRVKPAPTIRRTIAPVLGRGRSEPGSAFGFSG